MRRLLIAIPIALVAAGAAAAGWHYLRPHDPLAEARQLMAQGNLRAAQLVLRSAVQADPTRAEAHLRLGQVQLATGDPVAAERELRAAVERGADARAARPLLAQAVAAQGRNEEVLRDYAADGLDPEQAATVLIARARAQLGLKQQRDAAASVAEAQRLAPKSVEAALAAANVAIAGNDQAAAESHVAEALAIDPHALQALMLRAELRNARGDRPAALADYGVAIDRAQAVGAAEAVDLLRLHRAEVLIATGDTVRARADIDAVLKSQPKQPAAQFLSARLYAAAADWKAADAALAQVGPLLERIPQGDLTLAIVKANLGQPEQAVAAAERQVVRTPNNLAALKLLARLYLAQQKWAQAAEVLAPANGAARTLDAEALDLLGTAYAAIGQTGKAVAALRQASALAPNDTRLLTRLATLELRQGDASQAVLALGRALDATGPAPAAIPAATLGASPVVTVAAPVATVATTQGATQGTPAGGAPGSIPGSGQGGPTQAQTAAALVMAALRAGDIDRAVSALERLREAGADPVQVATLTGVVKLAQIDLDGARAGFEEAVRIDPKATAAQIDLARVLALQGHTGDAISRLQTLLAADPANAAVLTTLVNLLLTTHQPDQAVAAAEAAHKAAPGDAGIIAGLARLHLQLGHPQQALDLLDASAKTGPDTGIGAGTGTGAGRGPGAAAPAGNVQRDAGLLALRAQAQLALGQRPAAMQTLRTLLDQAPDNVVLRREMAELLAGDKEFDEARALLRDGLARRPGDPVLLAGTVAVAQREGGAPAALTRADELARDPANLAAVVLKGDLLVSEGRFADAATTYQALLKALPKDDPQAQSLAVRTAQAIARGGDPAKGAAMLQDWVTAHPGSADADLVLASFDITANRLPAARTRLESVLAAQPNNPAALNNLAWVVQQQGDLPQARALAARAYLLGPSAQTADTLGWIVLAQGQAADAVALLREAASGLPQSPGVQYHLAAALAKTGQKVEAVNLLKSVLDKPQPGFDEKPQAAKLLADLTS